MIVTDSQMLGEATLSQQQELKVTHSARSLAGSTTNNHKKKRRITMNRFCVLMFGLVTVAAITGCDVGKQADKSVKAPGIATSKEPRSFATNLDASSLASKYRNVKTVQESPPLALATPPKIRAKPPPIAGIWVQQSP